MSLITAPQWRFIVTTLDLSTLTFLDRRATDRKVTLLLNRPCVASGTVAADDPEINIEHSDGEPFLEEGVRLLLGFRREGGTPPWKIRYGGIILQTEDTVSNDVPVCNYTASDPWEYLNHRPVVNDDGDFAGEDGLSFDATPGDEIALQLLYNTLNYHGAAFIDFGIDWGGTSFWDGTIETTADLDMNFQQGCTVGEAWTQLCDSGSLDIVLTPVYDPVNRPGILCDGSIYAQAGSDRDSAVFAWDTWPHSLVGITRLKDGSKRANKIQFFSGQGGTAGTLQTSSGSVADFGEYWATQAWPGQNVPAAVTALAAEQLLLRKRGQTTVTISPAAELAPVPLNEYGIGDRVPVRASKRLRKALTGLQRVYGIPFTISDNSLESVEQLLVSADALS